MKTMMKTNDYVALIEMFNIALVEDVNGYAFPDAVCYTTLNESAMKRGYIIHPDACNSITEAFVNSIECNINSTFYKTWEDVTSKTRFELLVDQLVHYMTTYGTDFSLGNGYVPNNNPEDVSYISLFRDYKVIMPCTPEDLYNRCIGLLTSGIAMKKNTLLPVCTFIVDYVNANDLRNEFANVTIDTITNREGLIMLCDMLGIVPNRKFDLFRYIMYTTTKQPMIIKSKDVIRKISYSDTQFDFTTLNDRQINALASIFYRFKPLFLAFKKCIQRYSYTMVASNNAGVINLISRRAKKYHTPLEPVAENILLSSVFNEDELLHYAASMDVFKVVKICNTCLEHLQRTNEPKMYMIRNGKMYIKENAKDVSGMRPYYVKVFEVFYDELRCRLSENASYVKFNKNLTLAVPTSEKNFVGDIPFGSYVDLGAQSIVGIYWRNEWGTRDFDLSMIDIRGYKIGWNSLYYSDEKDIVYSGDMTSANPEATELIYFAKGCTKGIFKINRYSGNDGSKYKLFVANEQITTLRHNYMVNPANVKMEAMCISDAVEQNIGLTDGNRFYIMTLGAGYNTVSRQAGIDADKIFDSIILTAKSHISMNQLLLDAGYVDVDTVDPEINPIAEDATILDLTTLSRDTLINVMLAKK